MRVYVAEKIDVARKIAAIVGATASRSHYLEGAGAVVTWCVGHIVALKSPNEYLSEKWDTWCLESLPMIPAHWEYAPIASTQDQFVAVCELINDPSCDDVVCATDPDREGEGIFRRVYDLAGCHKPVLRLWSSSTERDALEQALENLRPQKEYDGLAASADARAKADWLVGLNGTRAYTLAYHAAQTVRIGRVKTPSLAMVVERDKAIEDFVSTTFWQVQATLEGFVAQSSRIDEESVANKLFADCVGKPLNVVAVEKADKHRSAPELYNNTALLRDAARVFDMTPEETMAAAESLYLKGLQTYPRTESHFLTEADADKAAICIENMLADALIPVTDESTQQWNTNKLIKPAKVVGHPAILPTPELTGEVWSALPRAERDVSALVCLRLVVAAMPDMEYATTTLTLTASGLDDYPFTAHGRVTTVSGWRGIQDATMQVLGIKEAKSKDNEDDDSGALPDLVVGQSLLAKYEPLTKKTNGPAAYTYDTLLAAMEKTGIGTSSTRGKILDDLVASGQIEGKGKKLISTPLGRAIVDVCSDDLTRAELTATWESSLAEVETGALSEQDFLRGVEELTRRIVEHAGDKREQYAHLFATGGREPLGACPRCGQDVLRAGKQGKIARCASITVEKTEDGYKDIGGCGFKIYTSCCGKKLTDAQLETLLAGKDVTLKGIKPKDTSKRPYSRRVRLSGETDNDGFLRIELGDFVNTKPKAAGRKGKTNKANWRTR